MPRVNIKEVIRKKSILTKSELMKYSVSILKDDATSIVEEIVLDRLEKYCSNKDFKEMTKILDLKNDFVEYSKIYPGYDMKLIYIMFFKDYTNDLVKEVMRLSLFFNDKEEDMINKQHLRKKRQIVENVTKIFCITTLTEYTLNRGHDSYTTIIREKPKH